MVTWDWTDLAESDLSPGTDLVESAISPWTDLAEFASSPGPVSYTHLTLPTKA